jgi:D-tyrosyl-tRNA(Tyr) deacylase
MRSVIQRVSFGKVEVEGKVVGEIQRGLVILLGIGQEDLETGQEPDPEKWALKVSKLRIFPDTAGKMNLSVQDINGGILIISQFTLYADTRGGNRPSFTGAAGPESAKVWYQKFVDAFESLMPGRVATGIFGADMKVSLLNDGPVTILM